MDAVRNLDVTLRSLGGGSREKMQEDWESIDLKKCLFSCSRQTCCLSLASPLRCSSNVLCDHVATFEHSKRLRTRPW